MRGKEEEEATEKKHAQGPGKTKKLQGEIQQDKETGKQKKLKHMQLKSNRLEELRNEIERTRKELDLGREIRRGKEENHRKETRRMNSKQSDYGDNAEP